jgi:MFS transporter, MCT family, solute carrier family 16 (monocarboxylic acid transporters), member 10
MRIIALIFVATTGAANITLRRRLPPKNVKGGLFNLPAFRSMPYTLYTASMCVGLLGIYTGTCVCTPIFIYKNELILLLLIPFPLTPTYISPLVLTYIDTMAVGLGINPEMSFYLVAIANAASAVGRFVPCLAANRLGAVNLLIIFTFIAAVMTIAWPFAKTFGNLLAISIVYGYEREVIFKILEN